MEKLSGLTSKVIPNEDYGRTTSWLNYCRSTEKLLNDRFMRYEYDRYIEYKIWIIHGIGMIVWSVLSLCWRRCVCLRWILCYFYCSSGFFCPINRISQQDCCFLPRYRSQPQSVKIYVFFYRWIIPQRDVSWRYYIFIIRLNRINFMRLLLLNLIKQSHPTIVALVIYKQLVICNIFFIELGWNINRCCLDTLDSKGNLSVWYGRYYFWIDLLVVMRLN